MYIGKPEWSSLELVSKFFVIKTELLQDGCLDIIRGYFPTHGTITNFIRLTMSIALTDTRSSHPDGECFYMMITAFERHRLSTPVFHHGCAPEFTAPYDKRFFQ